MYDFLFSLYLKDVARIVQKTYQTIRTTHLLQLLNIKSEDALELFCQTAMDWSVTLTGDWCELPLIKENSCKPSLVKETIHFNRTVILHSHPVELAKIVELFH